MRLQKRQSNPKRNLLPNKLIPLILGTTMKIKTKNSFKLKAATILLSILMVVTFMPTYAFAEGYDTDVPEEVTDVAEQQEEAVAEETEETEIVEEEAVTEEVTADETIPEEEVIEQEEPSEVPPEEVLEPASVLEGVVRPASSNSNGVVVEAAKSSIILHMGKVGTSGTAQIYRYTAESYHHNDPYKGLSTNIDNGTAVADYTLGTSVDIELARYTSDGVDHLYDKYYVIQGDTIVAGPFYASEIASLNNKNVTSFEQVTKKGLTEEIPSTLDKAVEMGVSNTVINWDLCDMIYANEDANGNPIDNSKKDAIAFNSNGETFYFNAQYIKSQDGFISGYTQNGINVTLVVISWVQSLSSSFPATLRYNTNNTDRQTLAFNTSNERGRKYFIAAMEFIAKRYSDKNTAFVDQIVIGNEIDYTYDWCLIMPEQDSNGKWQRADFNVFMEEYARGLRLANLAVKKYNAGTKVLVSFTHNWAENSLVSYGYGADRNDVRRYNSYAPKEMFDWLVKQEGARGNYNWGLSVHPYPIGTTSSNPCKTDVDPTLLGSSAHPINGNADTSPWITVANLELYQQYLERPANQYKGETRTVSITEASICNKKKENVSSDEYRQSTLEQAASAAMMYYRAACIPCINMVAYFEYHDQNTGGQYNLGLTEVDGTEKPILNVWKYVDTNKSFAFANKYLKYIDPSATSYKDLMYATNSGYDWDKYWTDENLMPRDIGSEQVDRSIATDKAEYDSDEFIMVTAVGTEGDRVCLFKAGDDLENDNPIYEYPAVGTKDGHKFYPGRAYEICAYGVVGAGREEDAKLKAGSYQVAIIPCDDSEIKVVPITIKSNYSYGTSKFALKTNKTTFMRGEDIIVSAFGKNPDSWVGIYRKGVTPGSGTTSIYWYYCNAGKVAEDSEAINGKPTVIQSKKHENGTLNEPGEYVLYLFQDGGYTAMDQINITIEEMSGIPAVKSLKYDIDVPDDGFANGVVTVTKDPSDYELTDCIMYWADADGNPLEGIGALAEFKLSDATTQYRMHAYTIIPEGAKKLIAYGANGSVKSDTYVTYDLPAGTATYHIDEPIMEFQAVSDVHLTASGILSGAETDLSNTHFTQMLEDTNTTSPNSVGIFIDGDIANNGRDEEYRTALELWQAAKDAGNTNLPLIHLVMGNHDWYSNNPSKQFQKWVKILNDTLETQPETTYYDEVINGYHFIYLAGEERGDSLSAVISDTQLDWFDDIMAMATAEDPDKPVFVFLHQSFYNTVAGSLPGQNWDGVANEDRLKNVMAKYGQIVLMNGHAHWDLNSYRAAFGGDEAAPAALMCSSVSYVWSSYNVISGESWPGSQGYTVKVYDDKVIYLGRDYEQNVYLPSAMFVLQRDAVKTDSDVYNLSLNSASLNLEAESVCGGEITYTSEDSSIAEVLDDGTVIAKKPGTVQIRIRTVASNTHIIGQKTVTVNVSEQGVTRIFGNDRFLTALKAAEEYKTLLGVDKLDNVILANGINFADALAGSYLSRVTNAPILLVDGRQDHIDGVQTFIKNNLKQGGTIYILGGEKAVPSAAVSGLNGVYTRRLGGSDRYETNIRILNEAAKFDSNAEEYMVASGSNFPDCLSVSAVGKPILLVRNIIQDNQKDFINSLKGKKFYIIGGNAAVSTDIEAVFKGLGTTERIWGDNRFATSTAVAQKFFKNPSSAVVAYGMNFPDGLCGGPLAYLMGGPLLLAGNDGMEAEAIKYATANGVVFGVVLGGEKLVNDANVKKIFSMGTTAEIVVK